MGLTKQPSRIMISTNWSIEFQACRTLLCAILKLNGTTILCNLYAWGLANTERQAMMKPFLSMDTRGIMQ
jgi:hypothetical protein